MCTTVRYKILEVRDCARFDDVTAERLQKVLLVGLPEGQNLCEIIKIMNILLKLKLNEVKLKTGPRCYYMLYAYLCLLNYNNYKVVIRKKEISTFIALQKYIVLSILCLNKLQI